MTWFRIEATRQLFRRLTDEPVVSSLSCTTIDAWQVEDRARNFYLFGGMGMASSIALGLAHAHPGKVIGLEGDGALLMNLGSLATISVTAPRNLVVIVWDNGCYESTGRQPTHAGRGVDLAALGRAAGIARSCGAATPAMFETLLDQALVEPGPWLIVAKVAGNTDKSNCPPWTPVYFKERFLQAMKS